MFTFFARFHFIYLLKSFQDVTILSFLIQNNYDAAILDQQRINILFMVIRLQTPTVNKLASNPALKRVNSIAGHTHSVKT